MSTVEELVQMMNTFQGQRHALNQEISRLNAENQQFRHGGSPELAETATAVVQAVRTAISNASPRQNERQSVVDTKGLGKLQTFKGDSARFIWAAKEDHRVSDRCVRLSFLASARVGGRSRHRDHEQHTQTTVRSAE